MILGNVSFFWELYSHKNLNIENNQMMFFYFYRFIWNIEGGKSSISWWVISGLTGHMCSIIAVVQNSYGFRQHVSRKWCGRNVIIWAIEGKLNFWWWTIIPDLARDITSHYSQDITHENIYRSRYLMWGINI